MKTCYVMLIAHARNTSRDCLFGDLLPPSRAALMRRRYRAVQEAEALFLDMIESRDSTLVTVHIHPSPHRIRTFYVKSFFMDGTTSPDADDSLVRVDHSDLDSLRAGLIKAITRDMQGDHADNVREAMASVRIIIVQNMAIVPSESSPPTSMSPEQLAQYVETLPALELDEVGAGTLSTEVCSVCLDGYGCGTRVVCLPCPGRHICHAACCAKWIAASQPPTCPVCRFALLGAVGTSDHRAPVEEGSLWACLKCLPDAPHGSPADTEREAAMGRELIAASTEELVRIREGEKVRAEAGSSSEGCLQRAHNHHEHEAPEGREEGTEGREEGTEGREEGTEGREEGTEGREEGTEGRQGQEDGQEDEESQEEGQHASPHPLSPQETLPPPRLGLPGVSLPGIPMLSGGMQLDLSRLETSSQGPVDWNERPDDEGRQPPTPTALIVERLKAAAAEKAAATEKTSAAALPLGEVRL